MEPSSHLYGAILAGGSGTRLWPISRELYPKQLLKLLGDKTLIQQTFARLKKIIPVENLYIVTNEKFATDIFLQLRSYGLVRDNILVEPSQRNTASAIGFAAAKIHAHDPEATLLLCPSDHIVKPAAAFARDVARAIPHAERGEIVTFGIVPTHPSTEYGYIQPAETSSDVVPVTAFHEKPKAHLAERYIQDGYFWNAGVFMLKTATILQEINDKLPRLDAALALLDTARPFAHFKKRYDALKSTSFDEAILERSDKVSVLPASFSWQDLGSWRVLHELTDKDERGNVLNEHAIELGCANSLVYGTEKRVVAALGITDAIIVDTEDAVLVAHRDETHRIKDIYNKLKAEGRSQHLEHRTSMRPWGSYTILEEGPNYKVKKLVVNPGAKLSLQMHHKRSEHWIVTRGTAKATVGRDTRYLDQHHSVDIPVGEKHRLENPTNQPLEIIEVQNGEYLGEDDIVRFEDTYKR